jgi:hypothetical protein
VIEGFYVESIAARDDGSVAVCGHTQGTVDSGSGPQKLGDGVAVALLTAAGDVAWIKVLVATDSPMTSAAHSIAWTSDGDLAIAGEFGGTLHAGVTTLTSIGSTDAVVALLTAAGDVSWAMRFGSSGEDSGRSVLARPGALVVGADIATDSDFGTIALSTPAPAIALGELSSGGEPLSARVFGANAQALLTGLARAGDAVILGGSFSGNLEGGLSSPTDAGFVLEVNAEGSPVWARELATDGSEQIAGVSADAAGDVWLSASFPAKTSGEMNPLSAGVLARVDGSGDLLGVSEFIGTSGAPWAWSAAVDASHTPVDVGSYTGAISFDGHALSGAPGYAGYIAWHADDGSVTEAITLGIGDATSVVNPLAVATDAAGDTFVAGTFQGSADFGQGVIPAPDIASFISFVSK